MRIHRIAVALITLIVIQFAFFTAVIVGERRQRWLEASNMAAKMANISRSNTEDFFNRYLSILDSLKSVDVIILQEPEASSMMLHRLNNRYTEIVNFAAINKDGAFFASGKPISKGKSQNVNHLEFVQRISSGEEYVIMQPHPGPISKVMVTGIAVPLKNHHGQPNGILGVSINYQAIVKRWENLFSDTEIMMAVSDKLGKNIHISSGLNMQSNIVFDDDLFEQTQRITIEKKIFAVHTVQHLKSRWNFSIFVPAQANLITLIADRKDLIFLFGLMVLSISTLTIWFRQEKEWTVKLQSEQIKLRQSEKDLKASQRIAHLGSWRLDAETNEVFWTEELYKIHGFDPTLSPPLYTEHMKLFTPESWQLLSTSLARTKATGIPYELELETVREDESNGWMWIRGETLKDPEGNTIGLWGVTQDITERVKAENELRKSETKYRKLFEKSSDAIFIVDKKSGKYLDANQVGEKLTGRSLSELKKLTTKDVTPQDAKQRLKDAHPMTESNDFGEVVYLQPDGTKRVAELVSIPLDDKTMYGIAKDITERKKLEKEKESYRKNLEKQIAQRTYDLRVTNAELIQANRLKDEFLANMSHELRTPLTAILGMSEALLEYAYGPLNKQQEKSLQTVEKSGEHLLNLINDILDLSKINANKMEIKPSLISIKDICRSSLQMITHASRKKNLIVSLNINKAIDYVMADQVRLKQILVNLLSNAVKFTPENEKIGLEVSCNPDNDRIEFTV